MPVIALIFSFIISWAGCNSSSPANHVPVTAGCHDSLMINVHDTFSVKMKVPVATGFRWEYIDKDKLVKLKSKNPPAIIPVDNQVDGGYGYQFFTFKGIQKGTTTLQFKYRRVFGKETKYNDSCTVWVVVN